FVVGIGDLDLNAIAVAVDVDIGVLHPFFAVGVAAFEPLEYVHHDLIAGGSGDVDCAFVILHVQRTFRLYIEISLEALRLGVVSSLTLGGSSRSNQGRDQDERGNAANVGNHGSSCAAGKRSPAPAVLLIRQSRAHGSVRLPGRGIVIKAWP